MLDNLYQVDKMVVHSSSLVYGLVVPKPHSRVSVGVPVSGWNSTSGTVFTSRPSRARDLMTMVEGGPTPEQVKTGSFPEKIAKDWPSYKHIHFFNSPDSSVTCADGLDWTIFTQKNTPWFRDPSCRRLSPSSLFH